jgi:hypothetical protein
VIKPLDVGNGLVAASVGDRGTLLSLGRAHPGVGYVELVAGPRFPECDRRSPAAVRRYRARLAAGCDPVVAVTIDAPNSPPPPDVPGGAQGATATLVDGALPRTEVIGRGWRHDTITWPIIGRSAVRQRHRVHAPVGGRWRIMLRLRGRLDRPALAQITEGGPLPPTGAVTRWTVTPRVPATRSTVVATAPALSAAATVTIDAGRPVVCRAAHDGGDLDAGVDAVIEWAALPDEVLTVVVTAGLGVPDGESTGDGTGDVVGDGPRANLAPASPAVDTGPLDVPDRVAADPFAVGELTATRRHHRRLVSPPRAGPGGREPLLVPLDRRPALRALTHRALHYLLGCAATRTAPSETCLVTDHRLLPLSWTRDAYWGALLLLADGSPAGVDLVERHLRWLFTRCQRPGGRWCRSHLPNGAPKDRAYAADQQLYPLLELCDFRRATGRLPRLPDRRVTWESLVAEAWAALRPPHGLLASDETPADDPDLPFLVSTHILWWWTGTRVAALHPAAAEEARALPGRIADRFVTDGPYGPQWAYAVDDRGRAHLYHDANDLPTALAPRWGLCTADDPLWRATMAFAWSPHNPGFVPGAWGGLGSRHTPGTWPLGDLQEWVAASLTGDTARATQTLDRLIGAATPDGMLPETYDPADGHPLARHWFAWPGSALGALYLWGGMVDEATQATGSRPRSPE